VVPSRPCAPVAASGKPAGSANIGPIDGLRHASGRGRLVVVVCSCFSAGGLWAFSHNTGSVLQWTVQFHTQKGPPPRAIASVPLLADLESPLAWRNWQCSVWSIAEFWRYICAGSIEVGAWLAVGGTGWTLWPLRQLKELGRRTEHVPPMAAQCAAARKTARAPWCFQGRMVFAGSLDWVKTLLVAELGCGGGMLMICG